MKIRKPILKITFNALLLLLFALLLQGQGCDEEDTSVSVVEDLPQLATNQSISFKIKFFEEESIPASTISFKGTLQSKTPGATIPPQIDISAIYKSPTGKIEEKFNFQLNVNSLGQIQSNLFTIPAFNIDPNDSATLAYKVPGGSPPVIFHLTAKVRKF